MLSVVLWKWRSSDNSLSYGAAHVNALARQIKRYIGVPYKIFCITDDADGLDSSIEVVGLQEMSCPMPTFNEYSHRLHSCYRRLKLFDPAIGEIFGKRILQLDIDMVIAGNISGIVNRIEPFLCWKCLSRGPNRYALNPSFLLMDVGGDVASNIWRRYSASPNKIAREAFLADWTGTEQAVMGYLTREKEPPTLGTADGIYSFRDNQKECGHRELARAVKVVSFHGPHDPSDRKLQRRCRWLARAWQDDK